MTGFTPIPRDEKNNRQGYREFIEARAEVADIYERADRNHDPIDKPDLAGIAIQQARARVGASHA